MWGLVNPNTFSSITNPLNSQIPKLEGNFRNTGDIQEVGFSDFLTTLVSDIFKKLTLECAYICRLAQGR